MAEKPRFQRPEGGAAPFDFAAAARLREARAKELLKAEEARNAARPRPSGDEAAVAVSGVYQQQGPPNVAGGRSQPERQQLLYNAVVQAFKSAGVTLLRPPVVEAGEGNLAFTVRARAGADLYELKLSSQRQFVLLRAAKSTGAFGATGLAANHGAQVAEDVTIPMVGQPVTLLLDLSRYVVERESGALVLVNEALLLSNLNENVLGRYGLRASSVHADAGAVPTAGFVRRHATLLLLVTSAAVVAAAAVAVARARRRG